MCNRSGRENTNLVYGEKKRTLERYKNQTYPKIPSSIEQLQSDFKKPNTINKYGSTLDGDAKFYMDTVITPNYEFTIFASTFVMSFIQNYVEPKERRYLMDGTFDSLPKGFYQMLIITLEYQNDVSNFSVSSSILFVQRP